MEPQTLCTELSHRDHQMRISLATARAAALAAPLFFMPPVSGAIDAIVHASLAPAGIGRLAIISPAQAQPAAPTPSQTETYKNALNEFKSILSQRRAQINSHQSLPNLPGQAVYLARNNMISAYKDLTDAMP